MFLFKKNRLGRNIYQVQGLQYCFSRPYNSILSQYFIIYTFAYRILVFLCQNNVSPTSIRREFNILLKEIYSTVKRNAFTFQAGIVRIYIEI